jgi:hypothetical protein
LDQAVYATLILTWLLAAMLQKKSNHGARMADWSSLYRSVKAETAMFQPR